MAETNSISTKPEIKCCAANHIQKICRTWANDAWKKRIEKITNFAGEEWLWTGDSTYCICTHHVTHHCTVRDRNDIVINIHCHGNDGSCNCELFRTYSVRLSHDNSNKTVTEVLANVQ